MSDPAAPALSRVEQRQVLRSFSRALDREAHNLRQWPELTWQQLFNRLQWESDAIGGALMVGLRRRSGTDSSVWLKRQSRERESSNLLRTLAQHAGAYCAFSPDNRTVLSVSTDHAVTVLDVLTGKSLVAPLPHRSGVSFVGYSPDGRLAMSGGEADGVRLWDVRNGHSIRTINSRGDGVQQGVFSPKGTLIATVGGDGTLDLWDISKDVPILTLPDLGSRQPGLLFSPDGESLLVVADDEQPRLINVGNRGRPLEIEGLVTGPAACSFSPDGHFLAVATKDGRMLLLDVTRPAITIVFERACGRIAPLCSFAENGRAVFVASGEGLLERWSVPEGEPLVPIYLEGGEHQFVRWRQDSHRFSPVEISPQSTLLVGIVGTTLRIWDPRTGERRAILAGHGDDVRHFAISPDDRYIVSTSWDETVKLWDARLLDDGAPPGAIYHDGPICASLFSSDGAYTITSDRDSVQVRDSTTLSERATLQGGPLIAVSQDDGSILAYQVQGRTYATRELRTGTEQASLGESSYANYAVVPDRHVHALAISPDATLLVTACQDELLEVWNAINGEQKGMLSGHGEPVLFCAFSPCGRYIASGSGPAPWMHDWSKRDYHVKLWDAETLMPVWSSPSFGSGVRAILVCADSSSVIAFDDDGLAVLDIETGHRRTTLENAAPPAALSPSGRSVACVVDSQLAILDLDCGGLRYLPARSPGGADNLAWSSDSRFLVSTHDDKCLQIWNVDAGAVVSTMRLPSRASALTLHPWRPSLLYGDKAGGVHFLDLIGLDSGPIIVTARALPVGYTARCPVCCAQIPVTKGQLGHEMICPELECSTGLQLNPFPLRTFREGGSADRANAAFPCPQADVARTSPRPAGGLGTVSKLLGWVLQRGRK